MRMRGTGPVEDIASGDADPGLTWPGVASIVSARPDRAAPMSTPSSATLLGLPLLLLIGAAGAQDRQAVDTRQSALYAVNAAALATAMTHCDVRHGGLQRGSKGAECFAEARGTLSSFGLDRWAGEIGGRCGDPATFNTCLTPEIARLVHALNAEFKRKDP